MTPQRSTATRKALGAIGLGVAILIGGVLPLAYAAFEYHERRQVLTFKAQLSAERVAKYIYGREKLWQYQSVRLDEILELPTGAGQIRQRVLDLSGKEVFDTARRLERPILRITVPIVVGSSAVGHLVVEESLSGYVRGVLLVVFFSSLVATVAYAGFRALPLRALDNTISELKTQNMRLDLALANMSQGLCLFDREQRLVVCNQRYANLYKLPPELTRPGTALQAIVRHRIAMGKYEGASREEHAKSLL